MKHSDPLQSPLRLNFSLALATLVASGGTLVCCVLPAVMVALGAGAALAGLIAAVPQLIWLSEHKGLVFGTAAALLALSGILLWRARRLPCPADPLLARTCLRLRKLSTVLWWFALVCAIAGTLFAFVLPRLH